MGERRPVLYLSEEFDYDRMIFDDNGPELARRQGWTTAPLSSVAGRGDDVVPVIDGRVTAAELERAVGQATPGSPLVVRVVDLFPDVPAEEAAAYRRAAPHPHVLFSGPYRCFGLAEELVGARPDGAYLHLPYAYEAARERPIGEGRRPQVALYGRKDSARYPDRSRLILRTRRRRWLRAGIDLLEHPGYRDIGEPTTHEVIGDALLGHLARFRCAYIDGTRHDVELLRYSECAYAGCAPVGRPAAGLPADAARQFVPFDVDRPELSLARLRARGERELRRRATAYRRALRQARDPGRLTARLTSWYAEHVRG